MEATSFCQVIILYVFVLQYGKTTKYDGPSLNLTVSRALAAHIQNKFVPIREIKPPIIQNIK